MTRRRTILLVITLAVAALAWYFYGGGTTPAGQPPLVSLAPANFHELRDAFNASADAQRLIILLSPT